MLTVKEVARRLQVSQALVYALCATGKLAHERYGLGRGTIRISEEAVLTYQEASRVREQRVPPIRLKLKHIRLDG